MFKTVTIIIMTFLISMMLMVMPLPEMIIWLRPQWVLMVLVFWLVSTPAKVGLLAAFVAGLFVDLLCATALGQHALIYVVVGYLVLKYAARIKLYSLIQQMLIIFLLVVLAQLLEYWIQGLLGLKLNDWRYWLSSISSTVLWPWMYMLLKDLKRRFHICE